MILVLLAILFVLLRRHTAEGRGYGRILTWALLFLVAGASVVTQVSAAVNSAPFHRVNPSDRPLFQWLGQHTTPGDVVATVNLRICMDLPVFTHNNTLLVQGSRTSASNEEILERFLFANALSGTPVSRVAAELREQGTGPHALPFVTYSFMLFEQSPYMNPATHSMYEAKTQELLTQYRNLQLPAELNRYRVDYVYAPMDQRPPQIAGWRLTEVLTTGDGRLWRIERA
jgi:hypothetical protein